MSELFSIFLHIHSKMLPLFKKRAHSSIASLLLVSTITTMIFLYFQEYDGPDSIHDEPKPVILVTKPDALTTVKKCQGRLFVHLNVVTYVLDIIGVE